MAQSGLKSGLKLGIHQGIKSGLTLAPLKSGRISGMKENITNKDKFQNPQFLYGIKQPLAFFNGDNIPLAPDNTPSNTVFDSLISGFNSSYETNITNLITSSTKLVAIDPNLNLKRSFDFVTNNTNIASNLPSAILSNTRAISFTVIIKPTEIDSGLNKTVVFEKNITTSFNSRIECSIEPNFSVKVVYYDTVTNTTSITYQSLPNSILLNKYYMITVTIDSQIKNTISDPIKIYINGKLNSYYSSGSCLGTPSDFTAGNFFVGATSSNTGGGSYIAAALVSEYAYSDIERIRIENYFRWYYGNKF